MCPSGRNRRPETVGLSGFQPAFDVLDADGDGKISQEDLQTFYEGIAGSKITSGEDIDSMISVADLNNDGFVEFDEFERILGCRQKTSPENEVMKNAFMAMDGDGDGKVGFEDLKSYMRFAGFSIADEDVKAMIRMGGGDEKEGVSYDALVKILAVDSFV